MRVASHLNPDALRRPQTKNKVCSDKEFVEAVLRDKANIFSTIVNEATEFLKMSRRTTASYLSRLTEAGLICSSGGLYWAATQTIYNQ
jgi:hypothetical protein